MSAEQQDEPAIGAYKLINYDVEAQFGEDCKNAATSAIALYYKGEKSHFQDVAQLIKEGASAARHTRCRRPGARRRRWTDHHALRCRAGAAPLTRLPACLPVCLPACLLRPARPPTAAPRRARTCARAFAEIEEKHGVTYHVIVGKNFGSFVTHEADRYGCCCTGLRLPRLSAP